MANYKNGIDTRNKLYCSAKKLFCDNGYNNTTVNDIVSHANSKLGLFTYYFESKDSVATDILKDYINDVLNSLLTHEDIYASNDALFTDMVEYRSYLKCTVTNPNISRFFTELSATPAFIKQCAEIRGFYFNRLMDRCRYLSTGGVLGIECPDMAVSLSTGMDVQLSRDLCEGNLKTHFEEAVDCYFRLYYRLICDSMELINKDIALSRKRVSSLNFTVGDSFSVIVE
jgi:AcrR family transcriptional regulator